MKNKNKTNRNAYDEFIALLEKFGATTHERYNGHAYGFGFAIASMASIVSELDDKEIDRWRNIFTREVEELDSLNAQKKLN